MECILQKEGNALAKKVEDQKRKQQILSPFLISQLSYNSCDYFTRVIDYYIRVHHSSTEYSEGGAFVHTHPGSTTGGYITTQKYTCHYHYCICVHLLCII